MTNRNHVEPAEAVRITQDIQDTLGFLEDLIEDPAHVAEIPSGSTLAFREVRVQDERFRLTAFRPSGSNEAWTSRVTSHARLGGESTARTPVSPPYETRSARPGFSPPKDMSVWGIVMSGNTADAALDALTKALARRALLVNHPLQRRHQR
jgi:hypothetical protein